MTQPIQTMITKSLNTPLILLGALFCMMVGGCEKVATSEPDKAVELDPTDPEKFAEAIWLAIKQKDYELVREHVIPRKRDELTLEVIEAELREIQPLLPESMMIAAAGTQGKGRAHTFVLNWDSSEVSSPHIAMIEEEGRWWILKL
ncbi:MAG: hypothetical protein KJO79_08325 [Verrucomicrobiae bacterium]|nr:hypothetical protein [Verrucomicrobiae bacterium]NNJ87172.1 hypothetical protein [Akkermansiaceae bacterium]